MDIILEPLRLHEVDDFTQIYWDAFNPIEADMVLPMIYPQGLQPDLQKRLRNRVLESIDDRLCFCARGGPNMQIVGVSWWSRVDFPPHSAAERDEKYLEAKAKRSGGVDVVGMNHALEDAFFKAAFYSEAETMGSKPYMTLKLLAVRPDYARKGVGTLLLRQGLEMADSEDRPAFIHAGVQAKPLYERYGFESVGEMPCDAPDFGGRSSGLHWCMVRQARSETV